MSFIRIVVRAYDYYIRIFEKLRISFFFPVQLNFLFDVRIMEAIFFHDVYAGTAFISRAFDNARTA